MKSVNFLTILFVLAFAILPTRSQTADQFVSLPGGFAVSLPPDGSSGGGDHGTAGGIYYRITTTEAEFEVGFYEKNGLPLALREGEFDFDQMVTAYFNRFSLRGTKISEVAITLQGYEGREFHYTSDSGHHFLRLWLAGERLYNILAETRDVSDANVRKIRRVLDSFEILDAKVVADGIGRRLKESTPADLPQTPVPAKTRSDTENLRLKGKVTSVLDEFSPVNLKGGPLKQRRRKFQEFDVSGRLLRQIDYDNLGNPMQVRVYGFVAGKRVARRGPMINYGGPLAGVKISGPTVRGSKRRFDEYLTYAYVGANLTEERCYDVTGVLELRVVHKYRPGTVESTFQYMGGRVGQRILSFFDKEGNEIDVKISSPSNTFEPEAKYRFQYDSVDHHGNWTKRKLLKWYGFEGKGTYQIEEIQYRTITYFGE